MVSGKWTHEDILPLNGTAAEVQELRERMMAQRVAAKAKKGKKTGAKISAAAVEEAIAGAAAGAMPNGSKARTNGVYEGESMLRA